jgi:hypothetical protein
MTPNLRVAGKVTALDGKTPHGQLVVELVRPVDASEASQTQAGSDAPQVESVDRSTTNRVLRLASTNGYVELPPRIFNHLDEATVEAWVKWERLRGYSVFFLYGEASHDVGVGVELHTDLAFDCGRCSQATLGRRWPNSAWTLVLCSGGHQQERNEALL